MEGLDRVAALNVPGIWTISLTFCLPVPSSAYAMWAHPWGSRVSWMKSRRWRFELAATQAIPKLQMSPICIGVVVISVVVQVALAGLAVRFSDWAA